MKMSKNKSKGHSRDSYPKALKTSNLVIFDTIRFEQYSLFVPISIPQCVVGIGKSLAYQPGLVVVGQYFKKRRGAAVGLATAGGGIGTLVLPPLFETMLNYYGFSGGLMIISAVALHMCISGMLYKSPTRRKLHRQSLM